jgi:hypothetical protein
VASQGVRITHLPKHARDEIVAEIGGAAFLAAIVTLPLLFLPEELADEALAYVLAITIGTVGYLVERDTGRARGPSVLYGIGALVAGLIVATLKYKLAFH